MSLSAEALAQLEGLDLQEARSGLNFVSAAGQREPLGVDLSADEISGLRSWDLSVILAGINSLTFEAVHPDSVVPAPVFEPIEPPPLAPMPESELASASWIGDIGEELPDWLKPAEEQPVPLSEEAVSTAPEPEPTPSDGPTEEEAAAGLEAAAAAGPGTQVMYDGEVVIPPAKEKLEGIRQGLASYIGANWKMLAEKGVGVAIGTLLGVAAKGVSPAERAGIGFSFTSLSVISRTIDASGRVGRFIEFRKAVHQEFYKSKNFIKRVIAVAVEAEMRAVQAPFLIVERPLVEGIGWGLVLQGVVDGVTPDRPAAEPAGATGGGERWEIGHPRPVDASAGQFGGTQPPADVATANEAAAQAAADQAAATASQAAEAARQAATRVVEVQSGDTLTELVARAGGDPYGADFTNTVLQSADVLTGPQNPNRDMAQALVDFIKNNPGVSWRDAINGVGDLAKQMVGGVPLKDAMAQATRMIYPGQEMRVVVGAAMP